ncbi:MAG: Asp-tRNA(Asn)/Glu-tRNA(Gln) amidotransferase subunit GatB [Parcubacteria group bacterium]|nr:Asp-tRNA(Asn)/Glu-tRNA(Gln) amidotransferase subunit GatB [Parcubacteria group bacterium]
MKYQPVIGLEIHAELKTASKMFCGCLNDPGERKANINICPVCLGYPGSLPVINQEAIRKVIKTALALNCQIPETTKFDRKNYFYPDLPKGYQISQLYSPLAVEGFLEVDDKKIRIREIHLEEDTGKLVHSNGADYSLVDFNRAGRPLMELVTEPDIATSIEARQFCEEFQLILRYLDVSEANMEKGQMRCEVNISLSTKKGELGTKVEIKNLNSFRAVQGSIDYEIKRQTDLLNSDEKIIQETRGWDESKQGTFSQRIKEGSQDYRYFPEPDLPPLSLKSLKADGKKQDETQNAHDIEHSIVNIEEIKNALPELPQSRRIRFFEEYQLPSANINTLIINEKLADYFEQVVSELKTWLKIKSIDEKQPMIKLTANYLLTELQKLLLVNKIGIEDCKISPENFAEFITLIQQKEISSSAAQTVLKEMFATGADPSHIIEDKELKQVNDEDVLVKISKKVIQENPQPAKDYQLGKENALQFLVGKVMAASRGQANPEIVKKLLTEALKEL